jgi:hypothetical protein
MAGWRNTPNTRKGKKAGTIAVRLPGKAVARDGKKAVLCEGVGLFPKRSAGLQPALDFQASRTVPSKGTLAQPVCGYKPVRDRRSGAARCAPRTQISNSGASLANAGRTAALAGRGAFAVRPPGKAAASGGKEGDNVRMCGTDPFPTGIRTSVRQNRNPQFPKELENAVLVWIFMRPFCSHEPHPKTTATQNALNDN